MGAGTSTDAATAVRGGDRRGGGRRKRIVVVAGVVAVGVAFLVGRNALAASVREQVHVVPMSLRCEDTSLEPWDPADGWPRTVVAEITEDMECRHGVRIRNDSDRSVEIERVRFPFLGPSGGPSVEAVELAPLGLAPNETEGTEWGVESPIDAIFDSDLTLPAGSHRDLEVLIVFRPSGCTGEGMSIGIPNSPEVQVRVWGVSGPVAPEHPGIGFVGHPVFNNCFE